MILLLESINLKYFVQQFPEVGILFDMDLGLLTFFHLFFDKGIAEFILQIFFGFIIVFIPIWVQLIEF